MKYTFSKITFTTYTRDSAGVIEKILRAISDKLVITFNKITTFVISHLKLSDANITYKEITSTNIDILELGNDVGIEREAINSVDIINQKEEC
jgi:hypothetical protein